VPSPQVVSKVANRLMGAGIFEQLVYFIVIVVFAICPSAGEIIELPRKRI
jgi:hypothetical protein